MGFKKQIYFETELEQLPKHSEDGQNKYLKNKIELSECLSYIVSNIICGVLIQNLENFLVYKYETIYK